MRKAMILAAGKGNRLRPLTDTCPKPLLPVHGKPLIVHHIENLKKAGIFDIVINVHHLGDMIMSYLGKGERWGVTLHYSIEPILLETAGGIAKALPLLGEAPFVLVNGDIWTDFDFATLPLLPKKGLVHLVMVNNPEHHPQGDFVLKGGLLSKRTENTPSYTYAGIAVISPELLEECDGTVPTKLTKMFDHALSLNKLEGEYYSGVWTDVGSLNRYVHLR